MEFFMLFPATAKATKISQKTKKLAEAGTKKLKELGKVTRQLAEPKTCTRMPKEFVPEKQPLAKHGKMLLRIK